MVSPTFNIIDPQGNYINTGRVTANPTTANMPIVTALMYIVH